jgi:hypothetical protein
MSDMKKTVDDLIQNAGGAPPVDTSARTLTDGSPVTDDHREIDAATGQQKGYVVLSAEERARGFVRPVRRTYIHVGWPAPDNLRDLIPEEAKRYAAYGYAKYQEYPPERSPVTGRYWTQEDLDRVMAGCKSSTTMSLELAETYARKPDFYSGTFCAHCRTHFPVGADGEFVWQDGSRVGT